MRSSGGVASLDARARSGGLRSRRLGGLVSVGDSGCWPRARTGFTGRLGGLALSSKQVAQIRRHLVRVLRCGEVGG